MSAPVDLPKHALTPDEVDLVAEFRSMNPWARQLLRDLAEGYAVDFSTPKPEPCPPLAGVQPQEVRNDHT